MIFCFGPSWSLFALRLGCELERTPCDGGGSTWLEFGLSLALFASALLLAWFKRASLRPYVERNAPLSASVL